MAGAAFVVVRCSPAYGYDFETGPHDVHRPEAHHADGAARYVRELVETGDFEGVLTWVVGLDARRAFTRRGRERPARHVDAHDHVLVTGYEQSRMTLPNVVSDATSS